MIILKVTLTHQDVYSIGKRAGLALCESAEERVFSREGLTHKSNLYFVTMAMRQALESASRHLSYLHLVRCFLYGEHLNHSGFGECEAALHSFDIDAHILCTGVENLDANSLVESGINSTLACATMSLNLYYAAFLACVHF
jgi:hypothetical protein